MLLHIKSTWLVMLQGFLFANAGVTTRPIDTELQHANRIFNVLLDSMRQWGSSLNHNGVSFFLATVPKGVQLYHGTNRSEAIFGMEWLAFEPEHAQLFARSMGPMPKKPSKPPNHLQSSIDKPYELWQHSLRQPDNRPHPPPRRPDMRPGWLHTYRTNKDLQFLYIDGMSAAKSQIGTLDSQDYILLDPSQPRDGFWEYERARQLCQLAQQEWSDRIQGFIRMEGGFEIILCSFEEHLDPITVTKAGEETPGPGPDHGHELDQFQYYKAIAARYFGIGDDRVQIDYDNFVTAYSHPFDLFQESDRLPRLHNLSSFELGTIRSDVTRMVLNSGKPSSTRSVDWQGVADMIVTRYSRSLQYLASSYFQNNLTQLQTEIRRILQPFIDHADTSSDAIKAEESRCAYQFLPPIAQKHASRPSLAGKVVTAISFQICSTLSLALRDDTFTVASHRITSLIDYLKWNSWKECSTCALDEICFIPIWPLGNLEDWHTPACKNATALFRDRPWGDGESYWGDRRW